MSAPSPQSPLLQPFSVRGLRTPNRIVMSPMTQMRSPGHRPGPETPEHYASRARGGTGLVVTEGVGVAHPVSVDHDAIPRLDSPDAAAAWRPTVDAVHAEGAAVVCQLWHVGPLWLANAMWDAGHRERWEAMTPMRPSGLWGTPGATAYPAEEVARWVAPGPEMTPSDIEATLEAYADSARWAVAAGFDGVEVHGGHGYLPDAFTWAETNHRTDRWGGPGVADRAAYPAELVRRVRAAIGERPALFYRFSQHTQQDYDARKAADPDELGRYLGALVDAGADLLDASTRRFDDPAFPELDGDDGRRSLAGWARRLTGVPTMAVGGIGIATTMREERSGARSAGPGSADNIGAAAAGLGRGDFDLLAVGRMHLRDPGFATTVRG